MSRASRPASFRSGIDAARRHERIVARARRLVGSMARSDADPPIEVPKDLAEWLGRLVLLYGVPFSNLVPDPTMLPVESIRFFWVDDNWTRRLIDGAASPGLQYSQRTLDLLARLEEVSEAAARATRAVRPKLRKKPVPEVGAGPEAITGFLLRSAAVSGWPGLEIAGYEKDDKKTLRPLLRLDRLASDVLLALFDGSLGYVEITEPSEGLHFGVRQKDVAPKPLFVTVRGLGRHGKPPGKQLDEEAEVKCRAGTPFARVLDLAATNAALIDALTKAGAYEQGDPFTAAELALQLIRGAGRQGFVPGTRGPR